ncbi:MAG: UV DNA damage repair endonuclease UvsE [Chloroflexi bacterium]|nr:UV DNA damage repair endonuclease UvsE [Chloroflexota bacterium]
MRLGFSVKVVGRPGLRSHDSRRWQNDPHLSVSLAYLRDVFLYLENQSIRMYRLSADLAPYLTHPTFTQFHRQIEECETELAAIGTLAREQGLRLSFHAGAHVVLNSPNAFQRKRATEELTTLAQMLDAMQLNAEAMIVVHVGGLYHNHDLALATFAEAFNGLPGNTQKRIALEHDDRRFGVVDCLWLHQKVGVRLVFDLLHHTILNPTHIPAPQALAACLATWPPNQIPKIHISTPATEMVRDRRGEPHPPRLNRHSHYVNPFVVIDFLQSLPRMRDFDMMLEAKAKDLALLQLRKHMQQFAPHLCDTWHIE